MKRIFTIIDFPKVGNRHGKYKAKSPKRAAYKAFSRLSRMINLKNTNKKNYLVFSIQKITTKSQKKIYKYIGTRVELHEPSIIEKGGIKIKYRHKNIIAKYKNHFENKSS